MNEERFDEHRLNRAWERDDEAFLRAFVFPVEDRRLYTSETVAGNLPVVPVAERHSDRALAAAGRGRALGGRPRAEFGSRVGRKIGKIRARASVSAQFQKRAVAF
jgi:hypothetical protein